MSEESRDIKNKTYWKDPEDVIQLSDRIVREKMLDLEDASVGFVLVDPMVGGKAKVAKFVKSNPEVELYSGHQYVIELSKDVWDLLDDETRYKILEHNLRKIFVDINKSGDFVYKEAKPDISEFYPMLSEYGVEWISELKTKVESVRDLEVLERVEY